MRPAINHAGTTPPGPTYVLSDGLDLKVMPVSTSAIVCRSDVDEVSRAFVMVNK